MKANHCLNGANTTTELCPPNPNELEIAAFTRPNTHKDRDAGDDDCKHSRRDGRFYVSYSAEHLAIIHDEHLSREGGWDWGRNSPTFTSCCFFSLATVSKSTSGSGFYKREMTQT